MSQKEKTKKRTLLLLAKKKVEYTLNDNYRLLLKFIGKQHGLPESKTKKRADRNREYKLKN